MLHTVPYSICLKQLRRIQKRLEICRIAICRRQILQDLSICSGIALVHLHYIGENIPILFFCETPHRFHAGERLEAEFRQIPEMIFSIFSKRLAGVPHVPEVDDIAAIRILRAVEVPA